MWRILLPTLLLPIVTNARMDCSRAEYDKCIKIADPLVKEAHLVFPDNLNDIDQVCDTWNQFVDCLKRYTDDCFTDQQRKQFNRAVESPIESVHEMCTQSSYQKEYLRYAPCIKSTIVQRIHCGPQYSLLVDQVDQGDIISKSTLCCSHDRFKQCVQRETRRLCDRGISDGPATRFATQIIDKALSFLQEQCLNYIPNSGDCNIHPSDPHTDKSDSIILSTSSSESQPWSTYQGFRSKEDSINPSNSPVFPWSVSISPTGRSSLSTSDYLGSRTRPGSYARASSWSGNQPVIGNTVQMFSEVTSARPTRPAWVSSSTWSTRPPTTSPTVSGSSNEPVRVFSPTWSFPEVTSETWYPAAGNHPNNEIDTPNQLQLQKAKNSADMVQATSLLVLLLLLLNILVLNQ